MLYAIPFPEIDPAIFTIPAFSILGFEIGPLSLRWYALAYIAGLGLGWRYISRLVSRPVLWPRGQAPMPPAATEDLLFWMTLGVVVGGRLGFVLFYDPALFWTFAEGAWWPRAFEIWNGGMAFHGGMLGVAIALAGFAAARGAPVLQVADAVAAATPIGLFFGRIANFINGELWGRPTDAPWGMVFPQVDLLAPQYPWLLIDGENVPRHPSQLYEAALEGALLFAVLYWLVWRGYALRKPGLVAGAFLLGYGLARGFVEFFRQWNVEIGFDAVIFGVGISRGQVLCIPMILAGAYLIWRAQARASERLAA